MQMKVATSSVGLRQKAVYWPTPKADGEGTYSFGASSEINCHWDDTAETFLDADGKQTVSTAVIFVDRDLEVGGFLWLGARATQTATDPQAVANAYPIKRIVKIPSVRTEVIVRRVFI